MKKVTLSGWLKLTIFNKISDRTLRRHHRTRPARQNIHLRAPSTAPPVRAIRRALRPTAPNHRPTARSLLVSYFSCFSTKINLLWTE